MTNGINFFIVSLNELFQEDPWYGVSVLDALEAIPMEKWNVKPNNTSNSIAAILWHMIDWRYFIMEKLKENKTFDIVLNTEADWRTNTYIATEAEGIEVIETLKNTQKHIEELLKEKSDAWLLETTPGKNYNNAYMLRGLLNHDAYHLGQINIIANQLG